MSSSEEKDIAVILDCEGTQALNDNAQETTVEAAKQYPDWDKIAPEIEIIPTEKEKGMTIGEIIGTRFFQRISKIDDNWGDFHRIAKDPSYSSGHTLKVILLFLKALGVDSKWLIKFAKMSLRIVPNIDKVLPSMVSKYNVWMISTSYEFFIKAYCELVGFDFKKAYCTFVENFDEIPITEEEKIMLLTFMKQVAQMPIIEYDRNTGEVIPEHQKYYDYITEFIWETVYNMAIGELLRIVHPVGQAQKLEALKEICQKLGIPKDGVMYVGDSQTDLQIAQWLQGEGLTMMFNGKGRVCEFSDIMYIGEDAWAIEEVAVLFAERGRQGVIAYYTPHKEARCGGLLAAVTPENVKGLEAMSVKKRKEFRGVHIGELT